MAVTYKLIDKVILTGSQTSVTFSSIPSTYTDLMISVSARSSRTTDTNVQFTTRLNGDTAGNYSDLRLAGTGSATDWGKQSAKTNLDNSQGETSAMTANTFASHQMYIPNYTAAVYKSASTDTTTENNATLSYATLAANIWNSTSAITSINFFYGDGSSFVTNSTFYLYGISKS